MVGKKTVAVPNAWEDDWETSADKSFPEPKRSTQGNNDILNELVSKAERLALHAESNARIWQNAEAQHQIPFHLLAQDTPPLKQEFKAPLKMLARRPVGTAAEEEDEEAMRRNAVSSEERRLQAQREREEKQRKYEEVRARLFGDGRIENTSNGGVKSASGTSSPGSDGETLRGGRRGRGRGRGGNMTPTTPSSTINALGRGMPEGQQPARTLFNPMDSTSKSTSTLLTRRTGPASGTASPAPRAEDQVFRMPRGPIGDGRGGFAGFAKRDANAG